MGKTCSKGLNNCGYEKFDPWGLSAPAVGLNAGICPIFSNILFSETAWPIKAKFHVVPPWKVGKKVHINGTGHMTKIIYGKKTFKNLLLQN